MPRGTDIRKSIFIPIPKDMNKLSWKVVITASNGTEYDVTNFVPEGNLNLIATEGVSNFSFNLDNNEGRYKGKFAAGDKVDFYYDYKSSGLTVIRARGYLDGVFDNFDLSSGLSFTMEGRDVPDGTSNEHFVDTKITLQFASRNNLDCWLGTTGTQDSEGNYPDGVLYNSGMILKVYDTADSNWKIYDDLTTEQKDALKAQAGYTQTHTQNYIETSRLSMSLPLANEGDYDFRIEYDSGTDKTYFMVHPEDSIININEHATMGQNIISLGRFGKDTLEEFNRVKEKGFADGSIISMRTKEDSARQLAVWIKDKIETDTSIKFDAILAGKAIARLNILKEAKQKGSLVTCGMPTLKPAEKFHLGIPYVYTDYIKVKSLNITFGTSVGLEFNHDLQDREETFERLFKDRIDENVNVTPTDNPNGLKNALIFDFSDEGDYLLTNCNVNNEVLSLNSGSVEGICTTKEHNADEDITEVEFRIKANQFENCTFEVNNTNLSTNWVSISPGNKKTFSSVGKKLRLRINLLEAATGTSPEFDKTNLLYS